MLLGNFDMIRSMRIAMRSAYILVAGLVNAIHIVNRILCSRSVASARIVEIVGSERPHCPSALPGALRISASGGEAYVALATE